MNQELLEMLKRSTPAEARGQLNLSAQELDARVLQLSAFLDGQIDSLESKAIIAYVTARCLESPTEANGASGPLNGTPELRALRECVCHHYRLQQRQYLTPEVLEWARRTFNEEEFLAGLREIEATGGLQFEDFIHELEQEVRNSE